jgi:hypothetical protein
MTENGKEREQVQRVAEKDGEARMLGITIQSDNVLGKVY